MACPATRHYCDNAAHREETPLCKKQHPQFDHIRCTRMSGHLGLHAGYDFSTQDPVSW